MSDKSLLTFIEKFLKFKRTCCDSKVETLEVKDTIVTFSTFCKNSKKMKIYSFPISYLDMKDEDWMKLEKQNK